jgi:uracil-DNA glycosylase family 4
MIGFFDDEPEQVSRKDKSLELAYQYQCEVCTLKDEKIHTKCMSASGNKHPLLYNIGEAPGETEDIQGVQFVGKSGQLLRGTLQEIFSTKWEKNNTRYDNVLACRPAKNKTPTDFEMACCRKRLLENIEMSKPRIIVGYGAVPLKVILEVDGIFNWRGRVIPVKIGSHVCWYIPTVHPAFILRNSQGLLVDPVENRNKMWLDTFKRDLQLIKTTLDSNEEPEVIDSGYEDDIEVIMGSSMKDLKRLENRFEYFKKSKLIFIDIETHGVPNGFNPLNKEALLLTCAISNGRKTVAFPVEHPEAWGNSKKKQAAIFKGLKDVISIVPVKGAHSEKMEISWMSRYLGHDCIRKGKWVDSMALAYTLDERAGGKKGEGMLSLGTCTKTFLGFDLKKLSHVNRASLLHEPLDKVLMYNGMDAKWEYYVYKKMKAKLEPSLKWTYNHENILGLTLAMTEEKGIVPSTKTANLFAEKYTKTMNELYTKIESLKEVKRFEKRYSVPFMLPDIKKNITDANVAKMFNEVLDLQPVKWTNPKDPTKRKPSTDKEVMAVYAEQGIQLAEFIVKYREVQKQKSTYVDSVLELIYPDGLLHPDFHNLFVSTGRLSCSNPNIQNFPARTNRQARNIVVAPPGHRLVAIDYAQIEARMIATISGDEKFCEAIRNDYDIHMDWAIKIAKRMKTYNGMDKDELKAFRKIIKNAWTFPLIYGSSQRSAEADLGAYEGQLSREFKEFWETYAAVKRWQDEVLDFYDRYGYVETAMGRRRRGPLSKNEALNSPIQGVASDLVTDAMNRLSYLAWKLRKSQYQPIWNIHDDLGFYIPEESLEDDVEFICEQMTCTPFKWITVPIGVEVSVGKEWGELEEIAKYNTYDFREAA